MMSTATQATAQLFRRALRVLALGLAFEWDAQLTVRCVVDVAHSEDQLAVHEGIVSSHGDRAGCQDGCVP
jgi:hypothetical protein